MAKESAKTTPRNGGKKKAGCNGSHTMAVKSVWPIGRSGEVEMVESRCTACLFVKRAPRFTKEYMKEMGL